MAGHYSLSFVPVLVRSPHGPFQWKLKVVAVKGSTYRDVIVGNVYVEAATYLYVAAQTRS